MNLEVRGEGTLQSLREVENEMLKRLRRELITSNYTTLTNCSLYNLDLQQFLSYNFNKDKDNIFMQYDNYNKQIIMYDSYRTINSKYYIKIVTNDNNIHYLGTPSDEIKELIFNYLNINGVQRGGKYKSRKAKKRKSRKNKKSRSRRRKNRRSIKRRR